VHPGFSEDEVAFKGSKGLWMLVSMALRQSNDGLTTKSVLELSFKRSDTVVFEICDAVSQLLDSWALFIGLGVVLSIGKGGDVLSTPSRKLSLVAVSSVIAGLLDRPLGGFGSVLQLC
jgi:hypothetical protein